MPKPQFEWSISLGSLLTTVIGSCIVPFLVWTMSQNTSQEARIYALETSMKAFQNSLDGFERRGNDMAAALRVSVQRIDDKISMMMMNNYRPQQQLPQQERPR